MFIRKKNVRVSPFVALLYLLAVSNDSKMGLHGQALYIMLVHRRCSERKSDHGKWVPIRARLVER